MSGRPELAVQISGGELLQRHRASRTQVDAREVASLNLEESRAPMARRRELRSAELDDDVSMAKEDPDR
jgi:hypothetical protein